MENKIFLEQFRYFEKGKASSVKMLAGIIFGTIAVLSAGIAETQKPVSEGVSLRGSHEIQLRQNQEADREKLSRIKDAKHLEWMKANGFLVNLPETNEVRVDPRLEPELRFCRPWVRDFLLKLANDFYNLFHKPIQINSAVRTVKYQKRLRKTNRNAAESDGPMASSHLTGATVDVAKLGYTHDELRWMRQRLIDLEEDGKILATEEHWQLVFHIMVFKPKK